MPDISIIIPVRNEEKNIPELYDRLRQSMEPMQLSYEVVFVTDVNTDRTYEVLGELNAKDARFKTIKLSNAFGQHIAVLAGLHACRGDSIVIMDGDLQDCPEDIPLLYSKLREGYDVVYGVKKHKNSSFLRNLFSRLFVSLLNRLSDVKIEHNTSMFRIISRRTADEIIKFREGHPGLTFIMGLINFPSCAVEVSSGSRKHGETKYDFFRLLNFGINSLMSFSTRPLRLISVTGLAVATLSFVYLCIVVFQSLFAGIPVPGWATIIVLITFLGGMQLLGIGVAGEYIGRIFMETKGRPLYIIDRKIGDLK